MSESNLDHAGCAWRRVEARDLGSLEEAVQALSVDVLESLAWIETVFHDPRIDGLGDADLWSDPELERVERSMGELGFEGPSVSSLEPGRAVLRWSRDSIEIINLPFPLFERAGEPDLPAVACATLERAGLHYDWGMSNSVFIYVPAACSVAARRALAAIPELTPFLPGPPCD